MLLLAVCCSWLLFASIPVTDLQCMLVVADGCACPGCMEGCRNCARSVQFRAKSSFRLFCFSVCPATGTLTETALSPRTFCQDPPL